MQARQPTTPTQQIGIADKVEPLLGGTGQYALQAVLIPDIWQWTPFVMIMVLAGLQGLDPSVVEALIAGRKSH